MMTSVQIVLGLVFGIAGFTQIAENPLPGCCALLLGGFLILAAIEQLCRTDR